MLCPLSVPLHPFRARESRYVASRAFGHIVAQVLTSKSANPYGNISCHKEVRKNGGEGLGDDDVGSRDSPCTPTHHHPRTRSPCTRIRQQGFSADIACPQMMGLNLGFSRVVVTASPERPAVARRTSFPKAAEKLLHTHVPKSSPWRSPRAPNSRPKCCRAVVRCRSNSFASRAEHRANFGQTWWFWATYSPIWANTRKTQQHKFDRFGPHVRQT